MLVFMIRRSAAEMNWSYISQCFQSRFVTRHAWRGSLSRVSKRILWASFPRCIQNLRITAPSTASVRSNSAILESSSSNWESPISPWTLCRSGLEYQALRKIPMCPLGGRSRQNFQ